MNNTYKEILERMQKSENTELYKNLLESESKEHNLIKFHLKRIKDYDEEQIALKKNDFNVSVRKICEFMDETGWK